jgi:poly(3-hydroxybutyrate) depolymerase
MRSIAGRSADRTAMNPSRMLLTALLAAATLVGLRLAEAQDHPRKPSSPTVTWVTRAVAAPRVSFHTFDSASTKTPVSYHLYAPAAYEREPERRFPVVYWLHGSGGGLPGIPSVARHFDAAIEAGKAPPCLVVFVNGLEMGMYTDWSDGSAPVESMIVKDLVAHIDATRRTIATREGRMLDGFSMGGYGAARLGFKFPEVFRAVSMMGAGPLQEALTQTPRASAMQAEELLARVYGGSQERFRRESPRAFAAKSAEQIAKGSLVRMVIGDRDDTFRNNIDFHTHLESLEIPHEWIVLKGVEHDPQATLKALGDDNWAFYRKAFGGTPDAMAPTKPTEDPNSASVAKAVSGEIKLRVKEVDRRAIFVNAPTDGTKRPAVVVLHGGMGSAEQMRAISGFDAVARDEGFLVVYGHGTEFGEGRNAWNTGHLLRRQVRDADDIAYLDALIDAIVRDHGADPTRIYMTGGSNGGMMTYVYAVARPERLAAIAPVIASMFSFDKVPSVPLPILIINGAKDEEVPLKGGMSGNRLVSRAQATPFKPVAEVVDFWVRANKSTTPGATKVDGTVTTTTYAAGEGGATTEFVVDSVGGHGWPGTRSRRAASAEPIASFKGAERVWEFFRGKSRSATPVSGGGVR